MSDKKPDLAGAVDALTEQHAVLETAASMLAKKIETLGEQHVALDAAGSELANKVAALETMLTTQAARIAAVERWKADALTAMGNLQNHLETVGGRVEAAGAATMASIEQTVRDTLAKITAGPDTAGPSIEARMLTVESALKHVANQARGVVHS